MQKVVVSPQEEGYSLEKFVKKAFNNISLSLIYKLFRKKDIKVNGHWEKEKYILKSGDEVTIYIKDEILNNNENRYIPNDKIKDWIIYEDNNILLVNKPRGLLVQADSTNSQCLTNLVIEYLMYKGEYDPNKNNSFVPGPAHRIDRNTSGIVIFGKNYLTLEYLFTLLKERELIGKHYIALVVGDITSDGEVTAPLIKDEKNNLVKVASIKDGAKEAKTIYKVIKQFKDFTLLDITLVTGRTHQIRVHMSYIHHPIVGDNKYGDFKVNDLIKKEFNFTNQFLHASSVHFGKLKEPISNLSSRSFTANLTNEEQTLLNKLESNNQ